MISQGVEASDTLIFHFPNLNLIFKPDGVAFVISGWVVLAQAK
jgi:hypothetical protein